ncbi:MAG: chromate efflux transporter [Planctomycetota bacterium]
MPSVPFSEAVGVWVRVALLSFGGPAGQIAVMHRILVEEKRWISERRFLHALNYCMLLPGPEAQQLTIYIGWLLHGWRGGVVAGSLFVLPGFVSILCLSLVYAGMQDVALVEALFFGLEPAVLAIVVAGVISLGRRALHNATLITLAVASFVAIFFLEIHFPFIILAAAVIGLVGGRLWPRSFRVVEAADDESLEPARVRPSLGRAVRILALWSVIWFAPLAVLALFLGPSHVFVAEGVFFSKSAVVTFGGAYAVLAYVAQQAVETYGWLEPGEMLDGLGMAETTPGPLIQVVQFVGFMAAFRNPGALDPLVAGVIGSIVVTWVTFAPCFLWIFLGAPYIESLRRVRALSSALTTITAAVVGVILNLAVWFAVHSLFGTVTEENFYGLRVLTPDPATLDPRSLALTLTAFIFLFVFRHGLLRALATTVALGMVWYLLTPS